MCDTGHHHDKSKELTFVNSRRALLRKGAGLFAFASATQLGTFFVKNARAATTVTDTPSETEGPFWLDVATQRQDIRTDPTTAAAQAGFPVRLTISLSELANSKSTPISAARIDLWHANAAGHYSDEPNGLNGADTQGVYWLRGWQLTNAHGIVNFITNYPMYYNGRAPHIHVRVRLYSGATVTTNFTTQLFFGDTISTQVFAANTEYASTVTRTYNAQDSVYSTVSTGSTTSNPDGARTTVKLADDGTYAIASYNIVLT